MAFLTEPFRARTWREQAWAVAAFVLGTFWFTVLVTLLATGASLAITLVGLPLLVLTLWLAGTGARVERAWAQLVLGVEVDSPPEPARREESATRRFLRGGLLRADRWRAVLYLLLLFPLGIAEFTVAVTLWSCALAGISAPLWIPFVSDADRPDLGNGRHVGDHPWHYVAAVVAGTALLLVNAVGCPRPRPGARRAAPRATRADARRARAGRDRRAARSGGRERRSPGARHRA
jgi:Putative sensor